MRLISKTKSMARFIYGAFFPDHKLYCFPYAFPKYILRERNVHLLHKKMTDTLRRQIDIIAQIFQFQWTMQVSFNVIQSLLNTFISRDRMSRRHLRKKESRNLFT